MKDNMETAPPGRYSGPFLLLAAVFLTGAVCTYYLSRPRFLYTVPEERNGVVKMTEYDPKMNVTSVGYYTEEIVSHVLGDVQGVATNFVDMGADDDLDACVKTHFIEGPFGTRGVLADTIYVLTRGGGRLARSCDCSENIVHVGKNDPLRKSLESGYTDAENRWNGRRTYSL